LFFFDESANISKEYTNGEITVVWKPTTCIHSEKFWRGLPGAFKPKNKSWIQVEGASSEELIAQIYKCPSGALSWYRNDDGKAAVETSQDVKIEVFPNGPVRVHGDVEITHSNGSVEKRAKITALCRCGHSANKPYCDGTHKKIEWRE
jgi:uncharacterized Fe-S cluster protein YjdI